MISLINCVDKNGNVVERNTFLLHIALTKNLRWRIIFIILGKE